MADTGEHTHELTDSEIQESPDAQKLYDSDTEIEDENVRKSQADTMNLTEKYNRKRSHSENFLEGESEPKGAYRKPKDKRNSNMSSRVKRNQPLLKLLVQASPQHRKAILYTASDDLVAAIAEIALNTLKVTEFIILGFFEFPEMQFLLFLVFLIIYLMSLTGNLLIIITVCSNSYLHSPMFFFLINLSFLEICYVTVTVPKLLAVLIAENKTISFAQCMIQMYLFLVCTDVEINLLTSMAYDRYVAICDPLHYTIIMNRKVCIGLIIVSWTIAFLDPVPHITFASQSSFCTSNKINHFFCDLTALMTLSCSGTSVIEIINYIEGPVLGFTPFILTIISYVYIISAILKIQSAKGRQKAFSTCSSHLIAVLLFYGTSFGVYLRPKSAYSMDLNKLFTVVYITVIPLLNPLIYSLRNKELKGALWKATRKTKSYLSFRINKMLHTVFDDNISTISKMYRR
uniref:Olfactory receptor 1009-like n=1 Tax=Geotrypetes seraphini TaxID=260995 RepID=A0A6P8QNE0_GEOSA|nr:olfactory receptor 1009-like [Geotrypetes seraphini]